MSTQTTTPPNGNRTVRDLFLDYVRKSKTYYDQANAIQREFTNPEAVMRFGSERAAFIACSQDIRWKETIENQRFMERLANMYGQVAVLNTLEMLLAEQQMTNKLLARQLFDSPDTSSWTKDLVRDYLNKISQG